MPLILFCFPSFMMVCSLCETILSLHELDINIFIETSSFNCSIPGFRNLTHFSYFMFTLSVFVIYSRNLFYLENQSFYFHGRCAYVPMVRLKFSLSQSQLDSKAFSKTCLALQILRISTQKFKVLKPQVLAPGTTTFLSVPQIKLLPLFHSERMFYDVGFWNHS